MQFDSRQAFEALAKPSSKILPRSLWDLIEIEKMSIGAIVSLASTRTGRDEVDDNDVALFSALVASYTRWGTPGDKWVDLLQGKRVAGFEKPARYDETGKVQITPGITEDMEVPFGEAMAAQLDLVAEETLGIQSRGSGKWYFSVVSGVLNVHFPDPMRIGSDAPGLPVGSGTRDDLLKCRKVIGEVVVSRGVPRTEDEIEAVVKACAQACSPTICGGWLNLGLYMVSAWEFARREMVRETGDEKAIPDVRPLDDQSIIDCYAGVFDLGPFRIARIVETNHLCSTDPQQRQHKFEMTAKHVAEAKRLKMRSLDPSLAPCGICGGAYKDHSYERGLAIVLTRDVTAEEAAKHLDPIGEIMSKDGLDGFIFLETPDKFRIQPPEEAGSNAD